MNIKKLFQINFIFNHVKLKLSRIMGFYQINDKDFLFLTFSLDIIISNMVDIQ